ncbi:hypothetical protein B0H17DRAFT_1136277 [Mycena rosella]|uniref:Uncharacterized protein n=1 Tax=Mycena rosella TaxID=1033263 RepID=A0AAD7DBC3_MYCRO|nr:hypothetical protein B0H17DRAFT_1136277 [Mycena rosella]
MVIFHSRVRHRRNETTRNVFLTTCWAQWIGLGLQKKSWTDEDRRQDFAAAALFCVMPYHAGGAAQLMRHSTRDWIRRDSRRLVHRRPRLLDASSGLLTSFLSVPYAPTPPHDPFARKIFSSRQHLPADFWSRRNPPEAGSSLWWISPTIVES